MRLSMIGRIERVAAAGALALLAACSPVGPNYVKPSAPISPGFKELVQWKEADGWKPAQPADNVLRESWWELYGNAELSALEARVESGNFTVAIAEARDRQARAALAAARAAGFPTASVGASETASRRSVNTAGGASSRGETTYDYLLPVSLSWEPDLWGRVRRSVEAGQADLQASRADLQSTLLGIRALLAQSWFQLRALDGQKRLLDETLAAYRKSVELTRNRYVGGVASKADVLQAETQLRTVEAQAIDIGVARAQLEHAIAILVGKSPSELSLPVTPLAGVPPPVPVGVPSVLLERRSDIAGAERRMASANARIGVAESAFYPNVTLSVSGGLEAAGFAKWLSWPSRFWALGPAISEVVFDGGLRKAQSAQARAGYDAAVASYRQTVLTGFQEVEDSLATLRILEEEARVQEEAIQSARQSVELATNQYKAGTVSYLNVVVAQTAALSNERTALDILSRRMTASVQLIKAVGGGWKP